MASFLLHKKEVSNENKNNYEPNLLTYKQKMLTYNYKQNKN